MKEQLQKACFPKISIPGQIVFEILVRLCPDDCTQILVNLTPFTTLRTESNLEGMCVESLEQNGTSITETICLACEYSRFSLLLAAKDFLPE